jgi:hypothetical protein
VSFEKKIVVFGRACCRRRGLVDKKPFVNSRAGQVVQRLGVDDQVVAEVVEGLARVGAERVGGGEGQTGGKEEVRQVVRQNVSGVGRVLASWAAGRRATVPFGWVQTGRKRARVMSGCWVPR